MTKSHVYNTLASIINDDRILFININDRFFVTDSSLDQSAEPSEIIPLKVAPPATFKRNIAVDMESDASETSSLTDHSIELVGGSQTFFPSFANLFEPRHNFRLGLGNQEAAYSQRPNSYRSLLNYPLFGGGYKNSETFGKQSAASAALVEAPSSSILGSGNFGVIKGGTFFAQNDGESDFGDSYSSFYNNGHGRPSFNLGYTANPRPNYNQDQFANFRDFADINTPSNSAYSHFVVVYANKNATLDEISEETRKVISEPKNIFETLQLLDKTEPLKPTKIQPKISKAKAKLADAKMKMLKKKEQWKKSITKNHLNHKHELDEPLLALS